MELFGDADSRPERGTRSFHSAATKASPPPIFPMKSHLQLSQLRNLWGSVSSHVCTSELSFPASWECSVWRLFLSGFTGYSLSVELHRIWTGLRDPLSRAPRVPGLCLEGPL